MKLELVILKFLRPAGDLLTPEAQLRDDVRISVAPAPTGSEISAALNHLEDEKWALSFRDSLTRELKWTITDQGLAQLAKRGL